MVVAYDNLAKAYDNLKKFDLARKCRLEFIILAILIQDKRGEVKFFEELGNCYYNKELLKEALESLKKALNLSLKMDKKVFIMRCSSNVAKLYFRCSQFCEAAYYFKQSIKSSIDSKDKEGEAGGRAKLGINYLYMAIQQSLSHYDSEEYSKCFTQSEQYLRESISLYEELFRDLREKHQFKISIVDTYAITYKALGTVHILTNRPEEALVACERGRACALGDILVSKYGMQQHAISTMSLQDNSLNGSDFNDLLPEQSCLVFYAFIFTKSVVHLWALSHRKPLIYKPSIVMGLDSLDDVFGDRMEHITKLIDTAFKSMDLRQMTADKEDRSLGIRNHELEDVEDADQSQLWFSQSISGLTNSMVDFCLRNFETSESEQSEEPLKELFLKLITPVQQHLTEEEIVIIPEGPLYKIPFAALKDPETGRFLCETKRIRLAPSLTTLKTLRESSSDYHSKEDALVIGNPSVGEVLFCANKITLTNLPAAQREACICGTILGVEPLIGVHATKDAVKEKLKERAAIIHIAAHGDNTNGQIALAPGISAKSKPIPEEEDYILTMQEVQEIGVRAQLVVLSCCHSGRGEIRAEGVVGMSRAFLAAGARAVVASLWAIEDQATCEFMSSFYMYLRFGDSASVSLNKAMEEMRQHQRYNDMKYWAPFFLIGDDVTIF